MKTYRSATDAINNALWYGSLVVAVPAAVLSGFGFYYLYQQGWLLTAFGIWLVITMLAYAAEYGIKQAAARTKARLSQEQQQEQQEQEELTPDQRPLLTDSLPDAIAAGKNWSENDLSVWQSSIIKIEQLVLTRPLWSQLGDASIDLIAAIADHYKGSQKNAQWRFTLPEALLIIEESSRRYRQAVRTYVPYSDRIQLSTVIAAYRNQESIADGFRWANRARRLLRVINPLGALIGEARDQVTDRVLDKLGANLQQSLQRLLLQEVASVAIELYSGRLKIAEDELREYRSKASTESDKQRPEPVEPIRAVILGQISAGKSSLVNALGASHTAGVDALPATARQAVHELELSFEPKGGPEVQFHLIDTPGVSSEKAAQQILVDIASTADMLIWVVRANQPGRSLDQQLWEKISHFFEANPRRRRPPVVTVVTHIDRLINVADDYASNPQIDAVLDAIGEQLEFCAISSSQSSSTSRELSGARQKMIPVCLASDSESYGLDALLQGLELRIEDAIHAQFNRRRTELSDRPARWRSRLSQTKMLGKALGKRILANRENP